MACKITTQVFDKFLIKKIEKIVSEELKVKHSDIADDVEESIRNANKLKGLEVS